MDDAKHVSEPTIVTTPSGDRMAILPLADYERLCARADEATDLAAYDEAKRKLASGEDELLSAAFAERILKGESPLRVWREYRGVSARDLAAAAEISAAYLSQIESGQREGTVSTMKALAEALKLSLDDVV